LATVSVTVFAQNTGSLPPMTAHAGYGLKHRTAVEFYSAKAEAHGGKQSPPYDHSRTGLVLWTIAAGNRFSIPDRADHAK